MKLGKKEMTREFIDDMIVRFKNNKKIHKKYVRVFGKRGVDCRYIGFCGILNILSWRNQRWWKSE